MVAFDSVVRKIFAAGKTAPEVLAKAAVLRTFAAVSIKVGDAGQSRQLASVCCEKVGSRRGLQETAKTPIKWGVGCTAIGQMRFNANNGLAGWCTTLTHSSLQCDNRKHATADLAAGVRIGGHSKTHPLQIDQRV